MKFQKLVISLAALLWAIPAWSASSGTRSVFLNGVDISSAKNQTLQHVNIKIDTQGNIYIEAPQYEAQQETTFVPLGKRPPLPGTIPQHRAPGPLPTKVESPAQAELAPLEETKVEQGSVKDSSAAEGGMLQKEGARIPADGLNKQSGAEAAGTTGSNPAVQ